MTHPNKTPSRDWQDVDDLLACFLQNDLTLREAEQAVAQLHRAGQDVVPRLLALMDDPHPEQHATAAVLLAATGDASIIPMLMDRVRDPLLDDMAKIKLITAVVQLDPDSDPDQLFSYLRDRHSALRLARQEHIQLLQSPHDLAVWLENVRAEMAPDLRLQLIDNSLELNDPAAVPMLICLCYDPDNDVALAAIDSVERFKDIRALRSLEELSVHHVQPDIRAEARKAADRLRIRAALVEHTSQEPSAPVHACYLSPVGGTGGQMAIIVRRTPDDHFTVINIIVDDRRGIIHCNAVTGLHRGAFEDLWQEYVIQGITLICVTHEQCLAALDLAVETSWQVERSLPTSFLAWRELIEHGRSPDPGALFALVVPPERRHERLARCDELLFQDEFRFWLFHPDEIQQVRSCYLEKTRESGGPLDRQELAELLCQGVRRIVTDRWRELIRSRLERMAPLLRELYEEEEVWQWAVTAADALADDSTLPAEEHPFLLGMLACSLENVTGTPLGWFDD